MRDLFLWARNFFSTQKFISLKCSCYATSFISVDTVAPPGLKNLRKPSTSSLEQVIVRQDTKDDFHLDMSMDDETSGRDSSKKKKTSMESMEEGKKRIKRTAPKPMLCQKSLDEACLETTSITRCREKQDKIDEPGAMAAHRFGVRLLDQSNSESTECLIPPAEEGAMPMAAMGTDQLRKIVSPPAVYRSEWRDVEDSREKKKPRDKPNKKGPGPGGAGWI